MNSNRHRDHQFSHKTAPLYITLSSDESENENRDKNKPTTKLQPTTIGKSIDYIPKTINTSNQMRLSILPMFPTPLNDHGISRLLLVNVSETYLSAEQLTLRRHYQDQQKHPSLPHILHKQGRAIPSALCCYFEMHYQFFIDLFKINWRVLDYNYIRFNDCLTIFANERMSRLRQIPHEVHLLEQEKLIAMEIFLQIDVDLFYWKTFSNRHRTLNYTHADIYEKDSSIFSKNEPQIRFSMAPCRHPNCNICSSTNDMTRRSYSSVTFENSGIYQFLNGYKTILNAPGMCNTNGIIYVLKCPCGQFEYIGESSNNLLYTLDRHRVNGSRIMHYFLIGERNISNNSPFQMNSFENSQKNNMRLYQHSPRCTVVMQMFLSCYPQYWIFVPMTSSLAQQDNANYITRESMASTTWRSATRQAIRNDNEIQSCMKNIPIPPPNYEFSKKQYDQQVDFFRYKKDQQLPDQPLYLYDASIIVVLPTKTSAVLRQFIVSLFITHAETNLNSIGNLLVNSNSNLSFPFGTSRGNWCHNLTNRSSSK